LIHFACLHLLFMRKVYLNEWKKHIPHWWKKSGIANNSYKLGFVSPRKYPIFINHPPGAGLKGGAASADAAKNDRIRVNEEIGSGLSV